MATRRGKAQQQLLKRFATLPLTEAEKGAIYIKISDVDTETLKQLIPDFLGDEAVAASLKGRYLTPMPEVDQRRRTRRKIVHGETVQSKCKEIVKCYKDVSVEELACSKNYFKNLQLPAFEASEFSPSLKYSYVGRGVFRKLHDKIMIAEPGKIFKFIGQPGAGKSVVLATLAAYMQANECLGVVNSPSGGESSSSVAMPRKAGQRKRVIYLLASVFVKSMLPTFQSAVALAYPENVAVWECGSLNELWELVLEVNDPVYLVIDEFNALDDQKRTGQAATKEMRDEARLFLERLFPCCIVVQAASINSETLQSLLSKTLPNNAELVMFSGPFSEDEFNTWLEHNHVDLSILKDAHYYTGYNPRLLSYLIGPERWEATAMAPLARLWHLTENLDDFRSLEAFLTGSKVAFLEYVKMDMELFYLERLPGPGLHPEYIGRCVSRYFQDQILQRMLQRRTTIDHTEYVTTAAVWRQAIIRDLRNVAGDSFNTVRIGWNVEALVICMLKSRGLCFCNSLVQEVVVYKHGKEQECWKELGPDDSRKSILFIPAAFNEEAVDLVYRKYEREWWHVYGIQISVSKWKNKKAQNSHVKWAQGNRSSVWCPEPNKAELKYFYVLPASVRQNLDCVPEVFRQVKGKKVLVQQKVQLKWISFGEINSELSFLDSSL